MICIKEVIVVEGRYDKQRLSEFLDAVIITTDGFSILQDAEKIEALRTLAHECGLVILTDSDRAGFKIRNHLQGMLDAGKIKHAYIPEIPGKERRKRAPAKDGLLGVEGIGEDVILRALQEAGCTIDGQPQRAMPGERITKADLYQDGFYGSDSAAARRKLLTDFLRLPCRVSVNSLLRILNRLYDKAAYQKILAEILKRC